MRNVPVWVAAVWWGSLSTLGFFVVPMLFMHLPTPAMAGTMAAKLFSAQTAISTGSGMVLLMLFRSNKALAPVNIVQAATLFVVGGVLMALLVEFAVAPRIVARENLALWHGVGTGMYVVQWLCAAVVFGKLAKRT
ncbi:DUF4149 domain-containing protein [Rhodoferax sp. AJA081-3]|uniref:DUF4149 domain-containing protein n=1 Tax=Rhodoferax sp. AJA081-3 TaxID=2752316 RepID=UPI001ADF8C2B|nr:DUF4149 domain-containing protein [Rhodoferax sp. AJA081-3]QTN28510.1 DUF4149 domain-containing protein [Rhodoferax sp. AJA081-3]